MFLQVPWRDYAMTAWQVDPALALSLLDHFPAVNELRATLGSLVVKHAAEARVSCLQRPNSIRQLVPIKLACGHPVTMIEALGGWLRRDLNAAYVSDTPSRVDCTMASHATCCCS